MTEDAPKLRPYRSWYMDKPPFDLEASSMLNAVEKARAHFKPSKKNAHMVHAVLLDVPHTTQLG